MSNIDKFGQALASEVNFEKFSMAIANLAKIGVAGQKRQFCIGLLLLSSRRISKCDKYALNTIRGHQYQKSIPQRNVGEPSRQKYENQNESSYFLKLFEHRKIASDPKSPSEKRAFDFVDYGNVKG